MKVCGETQQILDSKMLLAAAPGDRFKTEFLNPPRDAGRADVDQPGGACQGRQRPKSARRSRSSSRLSHKAFHEKLRRVGCDAPWSW